MSAVTGRGLVTGRRVELGGHGAQGFAGTAAVRAAVPAVTGTGSAAGSVPVTGTGQVRPGRVRVAAAGTLRFTAAGNVAPARPFLSGSSPVVYGTARAGAMTVPRAVAGQWGAAEGGQQ